MNEQIKILFFSETNSSPRSMNESYLSSILIQQHCIKWAIDLNFNFICLLTQNYYQFGEIESTCAGSEQ